MSGGHFNYDQYRIEYIVDEIEHIVKINGSEDIGYHYEPETIAKFREAVELLRKAQYVAQIIDWLVSGNYGEESFHKRWAEDFEEFEK